VASLGGGGSGVSSGSHQVLNVLGMPPKPAGVVLNQRRMSYDTATGSYMLVTKYEQEQERQAAQQQQQQQDPAVLASVVPFVQPQEQQPQPQQPQQAATTAVASSVQQPPQPQQPLQPQQHHPGVEQQLSMHLQLPEVSEGQPAQGSVGSSSSPGPSPSPAAHQMQAYVQRLVAALAKKGCSTSLLDSGEQQQQQQQGAGAESFSSGNANAAAAAALQQSQAGSQPAARQSSSAAAAPQVPRLRYTAKVCDFGFSQCLRAGQSHCSTAAAGTITHQAPEVLRSGHLSPAADIYAFGIIREWPVVLSKVEQVECSALHVHSCCL
jgi:hypothetical protein